MEIRTYNAFHGHACWNATILPTIFVSKELDYGAIKFGSGNKPDMSVLKISACWIFWSVTFSIKWSRG